ncbi:MAG: histidine kinase [Balneolales bacterium]
MNQIASHGPTSKHKPASWRFDLIFIIAMTLITGLMVDFLINQFTEGERVTTLWHTLGIAAIFTTVLTFSFQLSNRLLRRFFVPRSTKSVWIPIGFSTLVMVGAFLITAWLIDQAFQDITILEWGSPVFYSVVTITLVACIIGNTIYFGHNFYLQFVELERLRHESQMSALKSQINPHFMFNSLNSIASLVRIDPLKAESVIEDLSELFRYSLQSSKKESMTLREEVAATKSYFAIEKARFGERIDLTTDIEDEVMGLPVLGMILQPLVENCVKHGAAKTTEPFHIHLSAKRKGNYLHIDVTDNGPGFGDADLEEITKRGTGLSNIRDRLQMQYGNRARLIPIHRTVKLKIPMNAD